MPIQISCLYFILYFLLIKLNGYSLVTGWPHSKPNHPPPDGTTEGCSHEEHWKNVGRSTRRSPRGKFWSRNLLESLMGSIHIVWKGVFYGFSDWIARKWNHGMRKGTSLRVLTNTVKNISRTKSFPVGRVVVVVGGGGVGSSAKMLFFSKLFKCLQMVEWTNDSWPSVARWKCYMFLWNVRKAPVQIFIPLTTCDIINFNVLLTTLTSICSGERDLSNHIPK